MSYVDQAVINQLRKDLAAARAELEDVKREHDFDVNVAMVELREDRDEARDALAKAFSGVINNQSGPDYWAADRVLEVLEPFLTRKGTLVRRLDQNLCTCRAHPGGTCECDSIYCIGGTSYVGDDGSLWSRLPAGPA